MTLRSRLSTLLCVGLSLSALSVFSCKGGSGPPASDDAGVDDAGCQGAGCESTCTTPPCEAEVAVIPVESQRDIDVLFMIDNSGSMQEEQLSLSVNFSRFINVLSEMEGGLPNLHIGVVSSDVGGSVGIQGCEGDGDNGLLQNAPSSDACVGPNDAYISDVADGAGGRSTNYSGSLAETFSCIAGLGVNGCGFEQPLESLKRALSPGANPGFLRDDAVLVLVILSDEDDCSAKDLALFSSDENGPLGALSSFRCFDFGVVCDPDEPRVPGSKVNCSSREDSDYLASVQSYVDFFKGLKDNPSDVFVAGIVGNPTPVSVSLDADLGRPTLDESCVSAAGDAVPAIRLAQFVSSFPSRSTMSTICNEDLSDAMTVVAEKLADSIGSRCLEGPISQPFQCSVEDVIGYGLPSEARSELPVCDAASEATNRPCYLIKENLSQCPQTDSGLTLEVQRSQPAPEGTTVVVTCQVD